MNTQCKTLLILLLCLTSAAAFSQQADNRPKLFQNYPETIAVSVNALQSAFSATDGEEVNVDITNAFSFQGKVLSNIQKYDNMQSMVIKSPAFNDALLCITKLKNEDNSIQYVGRIINDKAFDGYELKKYNDGNYYLQKFETGKILQDCGF